MPSWETRFDDLLKYKAKHGNCNVPVKRGGLGRWVSTKRRAYKDGKPSQDRIEQLNSIGFDWTCARTTPWEIRFNELIKYKAKHGDCNVKRQTKLRKWVNKQRHSDKLGKLAKDRVDRLDGIGFDWTSPVPGSAARKTPICLLKQSLRSKTRTKIQSEAAEAELLGVKTEAVKDDGCDPGTTTEGIDEDDEEVGAMIYEEVMKRRQVLTRRWTRSSMKYH